MFNNLTFENIIFILKIHSFNEHLNILDKNISEQTLERKGYLRRVAKKVTSASPSIVQDKNHLFQALLLVGLDLSSTKEKLPYIKYKYPEKVIIIFVLIQKIS